MKGNKNEGEGVALSFSAPQKLHNTDPHWGSVGVMAPADGALLTQLRDWMMMQQPLRHMYTDYKPARLVRTQHRWYFLFYQTNPFTGEMERHRVSYNIGHYPIEFREAKAMDILDEINKKLPFGYPYEPTQVAATKAPTVKQGLELALRYCEDLRPDSLTSYRSWVRKFMRFLESIGYQDQPVTAINKKVALAYSDHITMRGVSARSHNNDINGISTIWGKLVERDIADKNPFSKIPRRKKKPSSRRPVPVQDVWPVLDYLKDHDISVYVACLLLYYCLIRPNEQRQLKRAHFHMDRSVVEIPAHISKNGEEFFITIPDELRDELIAIGFNKIPPGDYVIGLVGKLGGKRPVSRSSTGNRYRDALIILKQKGIITTRAGQSIYSWKNTGIDALANANTPARSYQNQARHHSLEESQRYMSRLKSADPYIKEKHKLNNVPGMGLLQQDSTTTI